LLRRFTRLFQHLIEVFSEFLFICLPKLLHTRVSQRRQLKGVLAHLFDSVSVVEDLCGMFSDTVRILVHELYPWDSDHWLIDPRRIFKLSCFLLFLGSIPSSSLHLIHVFIERVLLFWLHHLIV
jgi:hypothetical protein